VVQSVAAPGHGEHYTDVWAVKVDGCDEDARRLAERHGFIYVDKVCTVLVMTSCLGEPENRKMSAELNKSQGNVKRKESGKIFVRENQFLTWESFKDLGVVIDEK